MRFPLKTALAVAVSLAGLAAVHLWKPELGLAPSILVDAWRLGRGHKAGSAAAPPVMPPVVTPSAVVGQALVRQPLAEFLFDDAGSLDSLFQALARLEAPAATGHVAILHYGDSPTTADLITGDVRALLQQRFGDAGHGYLLAAKPWAWYGHRDTDIADHDWTIGTAVGKGHPDTYGLGGASFHGGPGAASHITLKDAAQTGMELSFLAQPQGGTVAVSAIAGDGASQTLASVDTASETQQPEWRTIALPLGTKAIDLKAASGRVELFGENFTRTQPGVLYDSLGLNGASTTVLSRGFNPDVWSAELRHEDPGLVIINYGTNESSSGAFVDRQYEGELRRAIDRIRTALPEVSILVMSPMDRGERHGIDGIETMATIPRIVAIQKRVAADTHCAFFDTFDAMGGDGTMSRWYTGRPRMVAADLIHPTPQGAAIIAEIFVKNLMQATTATERTIQGARSSLEGNASAGAGYQGMMLRPGQWCLRFFLLLALAAPAASHAATPAKKNQAAGSGTGTTATRAILKPGKPSRAAQGKGGRIPRTLRTVPVRPAVRENAVDRVQRNLAQSASSPFLYPEALQSFFAALAAEQADRAAGGTASRTVRVLQFGDSHTAADLFTGEMRAQLQQQFGDGGLGFQFAGHPFAGYHLAGSARSQSAGWLTEGNRFTALGNSDLGMGGLSIATSAAGQSISLQTSCDSLQLHYLRQPGGGRLQFTDNGTPIAIVATASEAAATTDVSAVPSRAGTFAYACATGQHDFEFTTLDAAPVKLFGIVTEQPGATYECLGINGAVAPLMLRWNQALFAEYLRLREPDLIVLAYGTNEAGISAEHLESYSVEVAKILDTLHRVAPQASVLLLGPADRAVASGRGRHAAWHPMLGTSRIIALQQAACQAHGCAFWDMRRRMGGFGSMQQWVAAGWAQPDRTHLTGTGYRALADALYADLIRAYNLYQQHSSATAPVAARTVTP